MEHIQSKQNARVKQLRKLHTAKGRREQQLYLVEGTHLVQEAIKYVQSMVEIWVTPRYWEQHSVWLLQCGVSFVSMSEEVAQVLSQTEQPQGIVAVIRWQERVADVFKGTRYLLLDNVQDPGNVGTMIRTADAAGFDGVVLGEGTVDLYNDKVLRATQGSLWHLPVMVLPLDDAMAQLRQHGVNVYATALHQEAMDYREVDTTQPLALIVGNEGSGVDARWIAQSDKAIYIPMYGQAESLNVAIAAGILMFGVR